MKPGGKGMSGVGKSVVHKVAAKVAAKAMPTWKAVLATLHEYGGLARELGKIRKLSVADANGIRTGVRPLQKKYEVANAKRFARKYGFSLVKKGGKIVGLKFFIKNGVVAPRKALLGGKGFKPLAGRAGFLAAYRQIPAKVKAVLHKAAKKPIKFISVHAAFKLAGYDLGKMAVMMKAAGLSRPSSKEIVQMKYLARKQAGLEAAVRKAAKSGWMAETKAQSKLDAFKKKYGDVKLLNDYRIKNGGLFL